MNNKVKKQEEERKREHYEKMRRKYESETPARRALIRQLYKEGLDLKEITFILRKAGYLGITGEKITMKEIMDENAQMEIEQHQHALEENKQEDNTQS